MVRDCPLHPGGAALKIPLGRLVATLMGACEALRSAETLSPSRQQVSTWPPRCLELCVKNVPLLVGEEAMTAGGMSCHRALTIRARKSSSGSCRWTDGRRRV